MEQITAMRPLPLEGTANTRELGGYSTSDGFLTKTGRFLRSDKPSGFTERDRAWLMDYGLAAMIDMRTVNEAASSPDPEWEHVAYYSFPLLDQFNSVPVKVWLESMSRPMGESYVDMLRDDGAIFAAILRTILKTEGCILFHCTSGKDRTGLLAMLLLGVAGVSEEVILRDYEVTGEYMRETFAAQRIDMANNGIFPPDTLFSSDRSNMLLALDFIHQNAGSIRDYLHKIGMTDEECDALRARMLD